MHTRQISNERADNPAYAKHSRGSSFQVEKFSAAAPASLMCSKRALLILAVIVLASASVGVGIGFAAFDHKIENVPSSQGSGAASAGNSGSAVSGAFYLNSGQSFPAHTTFVSYGFDNKLGVLNVTFHAADTKLDKYGTQLHSCSNRSVQVDEFGVLISAGSASPDRYLRVTAQAQRATTASNTVTAVLASVISNPKRSCTSGVGSEAAGATVVDVSKIVTSASIVTSTCGDTGSIVHIAIPIASIPLSTSISTSASASASSATYYRANFYHTAVHNTTTGQRTYAALVCNFSYVVLC